MGKRRRRIIPVQPDCFAAPQFSAFCGCSGFPLAGPTLPELWRTGLPSFGFYSIMLTSTIIGLVVMALFKPRTWCTFCPMGTMTQMICTLEAKQKL